MTEHALIVCHHCDSVNRIPAGKPLQSARCGTCHKPVCTSQPLKLNARRFDHFLHNCHEYLLVDFWAPWCGPCKMMEHVLVQAARQLRDSVRIIKINIDEAQQLAARYQIMAVPTMILFHRGRLIGRQSGAMDLQNLTAWVRQHVV